MRRKITLSNTEHTDYYVYLNSRSRLAYCYRMFYLYPILNREITGRTLDVGCGIGDFLKFRKNTIGVEKNPMLIRLCRERGLDVVESSNDRLPFKDASFDSVMLDNVLEHLSDPTELLLEARRVLRVGGIFLIGVPASKGFKMDPDHKVYYDEKRLIELLTLHGFQVKRIRLMPISQGYIFRRLRQSCVYGVFMKPDVISE
jgi:SAM-dependent methyltransferase